MSAFITLINFIKETFYTPILEGFQQIEMFNATLGDYSYAQMLATVLVLMLVFWLVYLPIIFIRKVVDVL